MQEEWRAIDGFPAYEVSDQGRIRRVVSTRGWAAGHIHSLSPNKRGYVMADLRRDRTRNNRPLHQLVLEAFGGPCPIGKSEVNHKNGIKIDNRLENLEWVSRHENIRHAWDTGLKVAIKGDQHGRTKISDRMVPKVIAEFKTGRFTKTELAKKYGVGKSQMCRILSNEYRTVTREDRKSV